MCKYVKKSDGSIVGRYFHGAVLKEMILGMNCLYYDGKSHRLYYSSLELCACVCTCVQ